MVLAVRDSWLAVPGCCAAQRLNQANPRSGLSLNELSALAHWRELWMTRQLVSALYPGQILALQLFTLGLDCTGLFQLPLGIVMAPGIAHGGERYLGARGAANTAYDSFCGTGK